MAIQKNKLNIGAVLKIKKLGTGGLLVLASCGDQIIIVQTEPDAIEKSAVSLEKKVANPAIESIQKVVPKVQKCPSFGAKLVNVEETKNDKICYYLAKTE
jgi:hypothetical protein